MSAKSDLAERLRIAARAVDVPPPPVERIVARGRRHRLLDMAGAATVPMVVVALLVWSLGSLSPLERPPPPPAVAPTGPLVPGPLTRFSVPAPRLIEAGEGAAWVVAGSDPDRLTLYRLDGDTGAVAAVLTGIIRSVAVGEGGVWVTRCDEEARWDDHCRWDLLRLNPADGSVDNSWRIELGRPSGPLSEAGYQFAIGTPTHLEVGEGRIWLRAVEQGALTWTLLGIQPTTGVVDRTFPARFSDFVVGEGAIWGLAGGPARVVKVDPDTGGIIGSIPMGEGICDVGVGFGSLWVADCAYGEGHLVRVSPGSLHHQARIPLPTSNGTHIGTLVVGAEAAWFVYGAARLIRIDPVTNAAVDQGVDLTFDDQRPAPGLRNPPLAGIGAGALWVAARTADEVVRVELVPGEALTPSTPEHEPVVRIEVGGRPIRDMAVGEGAAWVIVQKDGSGPLALVRIDARTLEAHDVQGIGQPQGVVLGPGVVWTISCLDDGSTDVCQETVLFRLDPTTSEVEGSVVLEGESFGEMAVIDGTPWVALFDPHRIVRIDPETLEEMGSVPDCCHQLAGGVEGVWGLDAGGDAVRIDPEMGDIVTRVSADGHLLAIGEGAVWVNNAAFGPDSILRIDPSTAEVVATIQGPGFAHMAAGAGALWTGSRPPDPEGGLGSIVVYRIDASTNRMVPTAELDPGQSRYFTRGLSHSGTSVAGVGEGGVWIGSEYSGEVIRLDLDSLEI